MLLRLIASLGVALCVLARPWTSAPRWSLQDISISELTALLESGDITSYELTQLYLKRIDIANATLHAVIEVSDRALEVAQQRDRERALGIIRGPLHGIPILVKDNYATIDDMATGAGSLCVAKSRPKREATVVEKLRKAGAIILGKTNLSEFSGARGPFPSGWSSRGNQTFGAYVEFQTACGSSSGSGVAASLGLAAAALGTETSGSITCPASLNNVVGIKPTMGLTSRFGVVPITIRQDTTGPLAQSVADAALILDAIAGPDANDNYTLIQPPHVQGSYSAALNESALQGKRIGAVFYEHNVWNNSGLAANMKQAKRLFDAAVADLEVAGAEVIRIDLGFHGVPLNESLLEIGNNSMNYVLPDFAEGLLKYMEGTLPDHRAPKTLQELLECIENTPAERATEFDPDIVRRAANTTATAGSAESWASYTTAKSISREILLSPLKEYNLDGLATFMDISIVLAAAPGLPIVTVPMGAIGADGTTVWDIYNKTVAMAPGMPLGLTFVGDQWSEHTLIGYAYAYEQVSKKRQTLSPYLKIDADLDSIMAVLEPKDL